MASRWWSGAVAPARPDLGLVIDSGLSSAAAAPVSRRSWHLRRCPNLTSRRRRCAARAPASRAGVPDISDPTHYTLVRDPLQFCNSIGRHQQGGLHAVARVLRRSPETGDWRVQILLGGLTRPAARCTRIVSVAEGEFSCHHGLSE